MSTLAPQPNDPVSPSGPAAAGFPEPRSPRGSDAPRGAFGRRGPRRGVLPKHLVRRATFAVVSLTIFLTGAASLLAVWDYLTTDTPWRALASLGIIAGTMAAFAVVNEVCGEPSEPMGG
ncbi:MAG: hypothetical protein AAGE65_14440 [Planctomycetota bacterium]